MSAMSVQSLTAVVSLSLLFSLSVESIAGGLEAEEYIKIVRLHLFAIPWRIMARSVQDLKGRGDQTKQFY